MRRILTVFILAATLTACQSAGVEYDQYTGKKVVHSQVYTVSDGLLHGAEAMAAWSNTAGYQVVFNYSANGGNWMFFRQAWSDGRQFPYTPTKENVAGGCYAGCILVESGYFRLSEADFQQAMARGLDFKVIGSGGAVTGKLPAEAFKQVASLKK